MLTRRDSGARALSTPMRYDRWPRASRVPIRWRGQASPRARRLGSSFPQLAIGACFTRVHGTRAPALRPYPRHDESSAWGARYPVAGSGKQRCGPCLSSNLTTDPPPPGRTVKSPRRPDVPLHRSRRPPNAPRRPLRRDPQHSRPWRGLRSGPYFPRRFRRGGPCGFW